jgi:hypothetical protein
MSEAKELNAALLEAVRRVVENWIWPDDGTDLIHVPGPDFQALNDAYFKLRDHLEVESE